MVIRKRANSCLAYPFYSAIRARKVGAKTAHIDIAKLLLRSKVNARDLFQIYRLLCLLDVIPIYKFFSLTLVNVIVAEVLFI